MLDLDLIHREVLRVAPWVVDPHDLTLTAWELRDDEYVKIAHAADAETFHTEAPYPVSITPGDLVN